MTRLTLYFREGCHLCDVMLDQLHTYIQSPDIEFNRIDIDDNPDWLERYNSLVPVLHVNDEPICKYVLDKERLDEYLGL